MRLRLMRIPRLRIIFGAPGPRLKMPRRRGIVKGRLGTAAAY